MVSLPTDPIGQADSLLTKHGFPIFVAVTGMALLAALGWMFVQEMKVNQWVVVALTEATVASNNATAASIQDLGAGSAARDTTADVRANDRDDRQKEISEELATLQTAVKAAIKRNRVVDNHMMHAINQVWELQGMPAPFPSEVISGDPLNEQ